MTNELSMNVSWKTIKISITGAKLSHLVQKDRIWDHGSMVEQARIIFQLVQKTKANGNMESLKKQCSVSCFEKLKAEMEDEIHKRSLLKNPVIKSIAVIDVQPGKHNRPDMFCALIKGYNRKTGDERNDDKDHSDKFSIEWSFVRQGDWWMLDGIKSKHHT